MEPKKVGARPKRRDLELQLTRKAAFRQVGLPDLGGELELPSVDRPRHDSPSWSGKSVGTASLGGWSSDHLLTPAKL